MTEAERRRLGVCAGVGFFLSPGAWLLQVIVSETVSAQTCDATTPLNSPGVSHLYGWLYGTSIAALAIAVVCAALSLYGFLFLQNRHARIKARNGDDKSREAPPREEEEISRKRFIALCSTLVGCGFVVAILFTILAEVFLVSCSQWH
ncbi:MULTISPECIES: hypothetical protein [unclassified Caballeronia]|uniref:hypothetical protein n=1 Tax=unclassified Caballeronia TaxID=2646786 RepID=UPI0028590255|nr:MULTISPECIES: hypothetical protein [unclassified Caballeronia]MDR5763061.1 hypothetical protein [Caballeronia sp. LZ035]MDR5884188.1 hypothetical protein [Caballeronia sp. LZ032]